MRACSIFRRKGTDRVLTASGTPGKYSSPPAGEHGARNASIASFVAAGWPVCRFVLILGFSRLHDGRAALQLLPIKGNQTIVQLIRQGDIYCITATDLMVRGDGSRSLRQRQGNCDQLDDSSMLQLLHNPVCERRVWRLRAK